MSEMIEVKGLTKKFGAFTAVDDVSFSVPKGQVLGFLGPNGAGKSTTMKIITGFLQPTSGSVYVNGENVLTNSIAVKKQLGYLAESAPSYGEMTVEEFLSFIAEIRKLSGHQSKQAIDRVTEICHLRDVWHQPIESLSKGYKQRVGFAQALIHDPPVLIMDEPTDGLDPNQKHEVRQLIKQMGCNKTIVLSTHILEEVEAICERVIIISQGKVVADARPSELLVRSQYHNSVLISLVDGDIDQAKEKISTLPDVEHVEIEQQEQLRVFSKERKPIVEEILQLAQQESWRLASLSVDKGHFDEVFREITVG